MKETVTPMPDSSDRAKDKRSGPKGIGMAVAFDWGLAVQILSMPLLSLLTGKPGFFNLHQGPAMTALISFVAALPFAALFALFGEGVRRGWRWTLPIQIIFNTLGFIAGIAGLLNLYQSIRQGVYWSIVTSVILLIFSPLIAWRLSRPETRRWFATITSAVARRRHGGMWPIYIALWALVGGTLQALATLFR